MSSPALKHCQVVWATPQRQLLWNVTLRPEATIAEALGEARRQCTVTGGDAHPGTISIPWDTAPVGIFGELQERSAVPRDGDRIEIYRPLSSDPRARRRAQVQQQRKVR
jgi:uncharacterized protein